MPDSPERTAFLINKAKSDVLFWNARLKEATHPDDIARREAKLKEAQQALKDLEPEEDGKEFLRSN